MPLIHVAERFFETKGTETSDSPLAVLFKRIGTGGTPLSDDDYVYSVIKHLRPETYDLVEKLHQMSKVASLLTATDLVMSTVRLAAVTWHPKANLFRIWKARASRTFTACYSVGILSTKNSCRSSEPPDKQG